MITVRQCRVLRNVLVQRAPHLSRVVITQCKKLRSEDLVDEICSQPAETNRLILLRPMDNVSIHANIYFLETENKKFSSLISNYIQGNFVVIVVIIM